MKTSDVSDMEILNAVKLGKIENKFPYEILSMYPDKVVLSKMMKLVDKGYLEYGVSLRTAWVTAEGEKYWKELVDGMQRD